MIEDSLPAFQEASSLAVDISLCQANVALTVTLDKPINIQSYGQKRRKNYKDLKPRKQQEIQKEVMDMLQKQDANTSEVVRNYKIIVNYIKHLMSWPPTKSFKSGHLFIRQI